jgi:hypothetical protein
MRGGGRDQDTLRGVDSVETTMLRHGKSPRLVAKSHRDIANPTTSGDFASVGVPFPLGVQAVSVRPREPITNMPHLQVTSNEKHCRKAILHLYIPYVYKQVTDSQCRFVYHSPCKNKRCIFNMLDHYEGLSTPVTMEFDYISGQIFVLADSRINSARDNY